jgi:putative acetyltransferase
MDAEAWGEKIRSLHPFVAELDGDIAGYADLQPSGYIDHFFVSGENPRRGVGNALMAKLHESAQRQGIPVLTADVSLTAEPFFARHGFVVVERNLPIRRGVVLQNALMRKHL